MEAAMIKAGILPVLISLVCSSAALAIPENEAPPPNPLLMPASAQSLDPAIVLPFSEARPVPQKPKPELARITGLLTLFKPGFKILYKGNEYELKTLNGLIRMYIMSNYKNEKAEDWIRLHAYKSRRSGSVFYLKYPGGKIRVLRDVLLEELNK